MKTEIAIDSEIENEIDSIYLEDIEKDFIKYPVKALVDKNEKLTDNEKIEIIAGHFGAIMKTLGLDLSDDSLKDTPHRVAKMFVKESFSGYFIKSFSMSLRYIESISFSISLSISISVFIFRFY